MGACAAIKNIYIKKKNELSKKEMKNLLIENSKIITNLENEKRDIIIKKNMLIQELETKNRVLEENIVFLKNKVNELSQKLKFNFQKDIKIKFVLWTGREAITNAKIYSKLYDDVFKKIISELDITKDLDNFQFICNGSVITEHFKNNDPVIILNPNDEIAIMIVDMKNL